MLGRGHGGLEILLLHELGRFVERKGSYFFTYGTNSIQCTRDFPPQKELSTLWQEGHCGYVFVKPPCYRLLQRRSSVYTVSLRSTAGHSAGSAGQPCRRPLRGTSLASQRHLCLPFSLTDGMTWGRAGQWDR